MDLQKENIKKVRSGTDIALILSNMKELTQEQTNRLGKVPLKYQPMFEDIYRGGIKFDPVEAFCVECLGFDHNLLKMGCGVKTCPLYRKSVFNHDRIAKCPTV